MTPTMLISCPGCKTKIRAPESAAGKKIRCKACENVFVVKLSKQAEADEEPVEPMEPKKSVQAKKPVEAKKAGKPTPPEPKSAKPSKPAPKESEESDDDGKAYGVTFADEGYRCPQCASEMDGPEAVVCLNCGFNLRTRKMAETVRIKDLTGQDKFLWLLPGILCALGVVLLITYWVIHTYVLPPNIWDDWADLVEAKGRNKAMADDKITGWYQFLFSSPFCGLLGLVFAFIGWKLGKFAVERLILHPTPPEREIKD